MSRLSLAAGSSKRVPYPNKRTAPKGAVFSCAGVKLFDQPNALAASTTFSTVKPKCGNSFSAGALAP